MLNLAKKEEWRSYVRLLRYCLPYKKRLAYAIGCMVLSAIFGIIPPWLIKNVVDDVLIQKKLYMLNILCVGVVVLYILKAVFAYGSRCSRSTRSARANSSRASRTTSRRSRIFWGTSSSTSSCRASPSSE